MGERLLVIGGDAAGMAGAAQVRRRAAALEIVALEKGTWTSYSACGIPYLVSGAVHDIEDLVARTPDDFRAARIDVRTEHEVVGIDLEARKAEVHNLAHQRGFHLGFDLLLVATGARPARPDLAGADLPHVHGVQTLDDAVGLLEAAKARQPKRVTVIGSGYVGLELAEAFLERGVAITVVEAGPEVMGSLDPEMGALVARALRARGITVHVGLPARSISETAVHTDGHDIRADMVILGLGVRPNSRLGADAGLETGVRDALVVDRQQRTSAEGVWAAGRLLPVHAPRVRPAGLRGPRHRRQQTGSGGGDQHQRRLRHLPRRSRDRRHACVPDRDRTHRSHRARGWTALGTASRRRSSRPRPRPGTCRTRPSCQ